LLERPATGAPALHFSFFANRRIKSTLQPDCSGQGVFPFCRFLQFSQWSCSPCRHHQRIGSPRIISRQGSKRRGFLLSGASGPI